MMCTLHTPFSSLTTPFQATAGTLTKVVRDVLYHFPPVALLFLFYSGVHV